MTRRPDVLIVGAGVIGCAIARELAQRGVATTVLRHDEPGAASAAAGGMLAPLAESRQPGPFLELGLASAAQYPAFAAALLAETGIDVGFEAGGKLQIALDDDDADALAAQYSWQRAAGQDAEWLDVATLRAREPGIAPEARCAIHHPGECRVDPRRLSSALHAAALAADVKFQAGCVRAVLERDGHAYGVVLNDGEELEAGAVVIAAGAWSGKIGGPRALPVYPVRGQMLALEAEDLPLPHVLQSSGCYLIPRGGRIIAGSTMEDAGFDPRTSDTHLAALHAAAAAVVPALAGASVAESWAGLRPATPDGMPILGEEPELPGLFYATGHFRNGILLAPITGRAVAAVVSGEDAGIDLMPFSAARFANDAHE